MNARQQKIIKEIHQVSDVIPGVIIINQVNPHKVLYMSKKGLDILNVTLDELTELAEDYYFKFFNEEEVKQNFTEYLEHIAKNDLNSSLTYFQQVRKSENDPWEWYLSVNRIILQENGHPSLTLTLAQPISDLSSVVNKLDRLMGEHLFLKDSLQKFALLSRREKEVLVEIAKGQTNDQISQKLFISVHTAKTHRKRIKEKLGAFTTIDLHRYASAFGLI